MEVEKDYNPETFVCRKCGGKDFLLAENDYEKVIICNTDGCCECYLLEQKKERPPKNVPHCPTCGSTNIQKIGTLERGTSVVMIGLFSKKINKSFKCGNCGYTW